MPKPDPMSALRLHRDGGKKPGDTMREPAIEPDAPAAEHHEDYTGGVLASAFRSVEKDSDAERALIAVVDLLATKHIGNGRGSAGGIGGDLSRAFIAKIAALALGILALVQPTVAQVAELVLSPSSVLDRKLDEVIVGQSEVARQQQEDRAVFIALAKWVVECEIARTNGQPMPDPPAPVRLILVQDEVTRSTGP